MFWGEGDTDRCSLDYAHARDDDIRKARAYSSLCQTQLSQSVWFEVCLSKPGCLSKRVSKFSREDGLSLDLQAAFSWTQAGGGEAAV